MKTLYCKLSNCNHLKARAITISVNFMLLLTASSCLSTRSSQALSSFVDQGLEQAFREALNIPSAPLEDHLLQGVVELVASDKNIFKLNGIEKCTNLTKLVLANNHIGDIRPLSKLRNLKELDLAGNPVIGIEPLAFLMNLERLNFGEHQYGTLALASIASLAPLSKLTNLVSLKLGHQNLSGVDLKPLANLSQLVELNLQETGISDIAALSNLANLEVLWLHGNKRIRDISVLINLKKLKVLNVADNAIQDFSVILNMKDLTVLYIDLNPIKDLSPLSAAVKQGSFGNGQDSFVRLSTSKVDLAPDSANAKAIDDLKTIGIQLEEMQ